jgi:hypothetical protein
MPRRVIPPSRTRRAYYLICLASIGASTACVDEGPNERPDAGTDSSRAAVDGRSDASEAAAALDATLDAALLSPDADALDDEASAKAPCNGLAPVYFDGLDAAGSGGLTITLFDAQPSPPIVGQNQWSLYVTTPAGSPLIGARVAMKPFMPQHGHGSPSRVKVIDVGEGRYAASDVEFTMPGYWQITVHVAHSEVSDEVNLDVCIQDPGS